MRRPCLRGPPTTGAPRPRPERAPRRWASAGRPSCSRRRDPIGTLDRPELEARLARRHGPPADDRRRRRRLREVDPRRRASPGPPAGLVHARRHATATSARSPPGSSPRSASAVPRSPTTSRTPSRARSRRATTRRRSQRGQAAATLVADALQDASTTTLLLVLDDLHVLAGAPGSWRFVEALVRLAPDGPPRPRHVSRTSSPFGVERLRGQGQVLGPRRPALAFTSRRDRELVVDAPARGRRTATTPTARRRGDADPRRDRRLAGGRPARDRGVRAAPAGDREAGPRPAPAPGGPALRVPRRGGRRGRHGADPGRSPRAVHFDRFTAPLLEAIGVARPGPHARRARAAGAVPPAAARRAPAGSRCTG